MYRRPGRLLAVGNVVRTATLRLLRCRRLVNVRIANIDQTIFLGRTVLVPAIRVVVAPGPRAMACSNITARSASSLMNFLSVSTVVSRPSGSGSVMNFRNCSCS
jgi:hypothetical protein